MMALYSSKMELDRMPFENKEVVMTVDPGGQNEREIPKC